jgi:superfamily I DNA/RNA helicase
LLKLERNYRSAQPILSAASAVVESTTRRRDALSLEGREGTLVPSVVELEDQDDEARWIADVCVRAEGDVAVLYRTNAQSRAVERELLKAGVSYQLLHAKGFFERKEIRDVLAYLRLLAYPRDDDAFERVANVPPRAVGPRSLERLRVQALELGEGMLHAAAHAKPPVPARAASNLKVFTDALDDLRELREATSTPIPAEEGHAGPLVGSMAWFLLEVLVCYSVPCAFDVRAACVALRGDGVLCASTPPRRYALDATPSPRRPRRAALDAIRRPARATSTT